MSEVAIFWNPTRPAKTAGGVLFGDGDQYKITDAGTSGHPLLSAGASDPAFGQLNLAGAGITGDLPFANLAQIAGLSVLGVTGNSTADVAAITAGTDNHVLRRSGTTLAFGLVDHGAGITGLTDDDHTQYALLAGRSGGQTLTGGTAAADDLTLKATSGVGAGSETITMQVGNNGALSAVVVTSANSQGVVRINSAASGNAPFNVTNSSDSVNAMTFTGASANANIGISRFTDDVSGAVVIARKSRGTSSSPSQSLADDLPMVFESRGTDAGGVVVTGLATFRSRLTQNTTSTAGGSSWEFLTVANGTVSQNTTCTFGQDGSVTIGSSSGAGVANALIMAQGTAISAMPSNHAGIQAIDTAGTAEVFAVDEGNTGTQISPHNFTLFTPDPTEPLPWDYFSSNPYVGEVINVDIAGVIKAVEGLTGKTFIHRASIPKRDWAEDQRQKARQMMEAYETWEKRPEGETREAPPFPTYKAPPKWIADRIVIDPAKIAVVDAEIDNWSKARPEREAVRPIRERVR